MLLGKYIFMFFFVWIASLIFAVIMEGSYLGQEEAEVLNRITAWQIISEEQSWGFWEVVGFIPKFFYGMYQLATTPYTFLKGTHMEIIYWMVWGPFIALFIYGMLMTLVGVFQRTLD